MSCILLVISVPKIFVNGQFYFNLSSETWSHVFWNTVYIFIHHIKTAPVVWRQNRTRHCIEIWTYFQHLKSEYLPMRASGRIEYGNRIRGANFLILFQSVVTMGLSCLVFEIWLRDGRRTDVGQQRSYCGTSIGTCMRFIGWCHFQ